jgi:hypothetical protein
MSGAGIAEADPVAARLTAAAVAEREGRVEEAASIIAALGDAIDNRPAGLHLAGVIAAIRHDYAGAAGYLQRALAQADRSPFGDAGKARIHRNLVEVYRRLSRAPEAVAAGQASLALAPDDPGALVNLGVAQFDAHQGDAALASFARAIDLAPETAGAHFGRGEVLLARGDYAAGWDGYAWRFRTHGAEPPLPPQVIERAGARRWDGGAFEGTLLLAADQGFGDIVQFARYLPWAAARCARLVVAARDEMRPVIERFPEVALRVADPARLSGFDAWAAFSDLPMLAGTRIETIPAPIPYLAADPARAADWRARLDELTPRQMRRVGLVWAGRPSHVNDFARSTRLARLRPLLDTAGVVWVSLQKGAAQAEIGDARSRAPLLNLGAEIEDYEDTMAILAALDLVVTVDTSVAHFAGAMGCDVWIMLPHRAEWRWGLHGDRSPWYPTARLFRQPEPMAWEAVAEDVAAALAQREAPQPDRRRRQR